VNGDGYADFVAGAPGANGNAGRVYVMKSNGQPGPGFGGCLPPPPGGGDSGGGGGGTSGGSGGGGGGSTRTPGKKVVLLVKRTLTLKSSQSTVSLSRGVTLVGTLRASESKRSCQRKQKVAIQRYSAVSRSWPTIDVAVTKANGRFTAHLRPALAETLRYRAVVKRTKRCMGATSKKIKVKVKG
jgi:hypothetical protein